MNRYVVFISNPFGFGPSGKAVALMEELAIKWKKGKIVYIASKLCQEILPKKLKKQIIIETADERNETILKNLLLKYPTPFVVCTLNKVAIKTAKSLGLRAFFVDSLSWMWKKIPEEYLLADTYYCFDLFDTRNKIPKLDNIKIIPPVFGYLPKVNVHKKSYTLLHLGGFDNPYQHKIFETYLNLLIESLKNNLSKQLIVSGGDEAMQYMKKRLENTKILFKTFSRNQFLHTLNNASHFITTSGLTATLEAFALKTPVSFIPPTNLSQWRILKLLIDMGCADLRIEWNDIVDFNKDLSEFTEKDSLPVFYDAAKEVDNNLFTKQSFIQKFRCMLNTIPDNSKQSQYIDTIGKTGSKVIIEDIISVIS